MKEFIRFFLYIPMLCMTMIACGGDNDDNGSDDGTGNTAEANINRNIVTNDNAVMRLEFPHLKGGNNIVLVYRTSSTEFDKDKVNFSVEWDKDKKSQRWTCYQMHSGYKGNYSRVVDGYMNDTQLPKGSYLEEDYYYGSGFQHGHICPNADRSFSYDANYQTFYLTNMQPQYPRFNGYSNSGSNRGEGLWLRLEDKVRGWSPKVKTDTLYICKGGAIDDENDYIGKIKGKLIIPRHFFMACLLKEGNAYRAIGFYMEQKNQWATNDNLADYAVSIDKLEELTGIDFFCNMPDEKENDVERNLAYKVWGLSK